VFVTVTGVGCTESPASGPIGFITVPLTAQGAGGVTYRLPPHTVLGLGEPGQIRGFELDPDAMTQTIEVRAGQYPVSLTDPAGDTAVWPLTRVAPDGTTETVQAMLELAPTVTVVAHQTVPLVIRFQVTGIGPITFDVGSISVAVEVDESPATAFDVTITAPSLVAQVVTVGANAPAALAPRLPAQGSTGDGYTLITHTTGPWSFVSSVTACAPVSASPSARGNQGLVELVAETPPNDFQQLCIEQFAPDQALLILSFFRSGRPTTPLLSDLGSFDYFLFHDVLVTVAGNVFDGVTLDLRPLSGAHPATMSLFGVISATPVGMMSRASAIAAETTPDTWYQVEERGDATVTLTGH
jgi:hypothetical protein